MVEHGTGDRGDGEAVPLPCGRNVLRALDEHESDALDLLVDRDEQVLLLGLTAAVEAVEAGGVEAGQDGVRPRVQQRRDPPLVQRRFAGAEEDDPREQQRPRAALLASSVHGPLGDAEPHQFGDTDHEVPAGRPQPGEIVGPCPSSHAVTVARGGSPAHSSR